MNVQVSQDEAAVMLDAAALKVIKKVVVTEGESKNEMVAKAKGLQRNKGIQPQPTQASY